MTSIFYAGVNLHILTEDKIETVRQFRNQESIRSQLVYSGVVSEQQQKEWFKKINPDKEIYFIASHVNHCFDFGMLYIKHMDSEKKCGESGGFICDQYVGTQFLAFKSTVMLNYYFFDILEYETMVTSCFKNNRAALRYNLSLGYKQTHELENGLLYFEMNKEDFEPMKARIYKTLSDSEVQFHY